MKFSWFTHRQRLLVTEVFYLFIMCVAIPFAIGHNIFDKYSFIFSLILLNCLNIPSIVLFYRWLLPVTFGSGRMWLFLLLFPVYLFVYELSGRLGEILLIHLPFIPHVYQLGIASAHPEKFQWGIFLQNFGWTGLVLLAATSLYMVRQLFKSQDKLYQADTARLNIELVHLKGQIQPHFFFNTLNNLYALSTIGSPKAPAMIADLSAIMRYVLYETEQEKVTLEREINFMKSYIELETIRHDGPGIIEFDVQGDPASVQIEPLLFLPLVENAFKHSLQSEMPDKFVRITLVINEDELIFQTSNPRQLTETEPPVKNEIGIGIKNIKKRLELLYPGKYQFYVESGQLFNVFLSLQLN